MLVAEQAVHSSLTLATLRDQVVGVERLVPLLDGTPRQYVNLDNAASTPALRPVQQKVDELLEWYASVHRGSGFKSQLSTNAYERARQIVAGFVGADPEQQTVIFTKNTSEALNLLADAIDWQPGDVVISSVMEHHSNDLPWRPRAQVIHVGVTAEGALDLDAMHDAIRTHAGRVRLVAVTGASNLTGFMPPVHTIAEWAHAAGALMVMDAAQLAPHRKIDMRPPGSAQHLDFVALSGHKMYAPYGSGALIGPKAVFLARAPHYRGGGTIEIVSLDEVHWADPPERDEVGSPNVIGAVALAAAMQVLDQVGMDRLAEHEKNLTRHALLKLKAIQRLRLYGSIDPERLDDRLGVIALAVEGEPHAKVAAILSFEGAIGVRNGCFCAHPYVLELLGVAGLDYIRHRDEVLAGDRSHLPGLVRASFGCYNTIEEVDHLATMLQRVSAADYEGEYVVDRPSGSYLPRNFDPAILSRTFSL